VRAGVPARLTAIYARVSTDEQAEHGTSLEEQVRRCRAHAGPDAEIIEFVDDGVSGKSLQRPQLQTLLERARQGAIGRVICLDPDRLARNLLHQLMIADDLRAAGVQVEFLQFGADTGSPDGKLLFHVRGAISEFEAAQIARRMYSGKLVRAREGRVAGGTCIFGYRLDRLRQQWVEEPREARTVRMMFAWAPEMGTWRIAQRLNAEGVRSRFGGRWSQSSVIGILRNATYTGRMPQMRGAGYVPVPPLVSSEQYERVQRALSERHNRPPGRTTHPYLLTGRLTCGICGRSMCGGYGRPTKNGTTTYYGCSGKVKPTDPQRPCSSRLWRSDRLDAQVWAHVTAWLRDPEAYAEAAAALASEPGRTAGLEAELDGLAHEARGLEAERDRLIRAFRRGLITEEDLARQQREVQAEARALQQRMRAVEADLRSAALRADDLRRVEEAVRRVVADTPSLDSVEARRAVLQALAVRVTAGPGDAVRIRVDASL
jgi:site-specific DNA recombinase